MKIKVLLSVAVCILALTACGPNLEDAQKLGFKSVEEMNTLQKLGYENKDAWDKRYLKFGFNSLEQMNLMAKRNFETFDDYELAKKYSPLVFFNSCKEQTSDNYGRLCKGKKITWTGVPISFGSDGVRVVLFDNDEPLFAIDSKDLKSKIDESSLGKEIEFDGVVGNLNTWHPDVDGISYFEIKEDSPNVPMAYNPKNWNWKLLFEASVTKSTNIPGMGYYSIPVQTNYYYINEKSPILKMDQNIIQVTYMESTAKGIIAEYGSSNTNSPDIETLKVNCKSGTVKVIYKGTFYIKPKSEEVKLDKVTGEKSINIIQESKSLGSFHVKNKEKYNDWKEPSTQLLGFVRRACNSVGF